MATIILVEREKCVFFRTDVVIIHTVNILPLISDKISNRLLFFFVVFFFKLKDTEF